MAKGLVIAAPRSGAGKTVVTLGLLAALRQRGRRVAPAKVGPDYIDPVFLGRAASREAINLDPWSMRPARLKALAAMQAIGADLLVVEGVMGLFDAAADNTGSTADLAELLGLPVIMVVDAERQSQSIAPLVAGFVQWRSGVHVVGVILNRVSSMKHEHMLMGALAATGIACLGSLPRDRRLVLPERHLGLVLPDEMVAFKDFLDIACRVMQHHVDLERLEELAAPLERRTKKCMRDFWLTCGANKKPADAQTAPVPLPPLGQRMAIARDEAFAFLYPHLLTGWLVAGAELSFFSPLADEAPRKDADVVFLPGGYPELYGQSLANAHHFQAGMRAARDRGALIYAECGGFMVLGETLVDKTGVPHAMTGLLPLTTRIDQPRRVLGYRRLLQAGALPWPARLNGHEFHYSSVQQGQLEPLFIATDALGGALQPMGAVIGRVMGSYAHVVDAA